MFVVPEEVRAYYSDCKEKSLKSEYSWNDLFTLYSNHYPDLAKEYERRMMGVLPTNWKANLPTYSHNETKVVATRNRSEEVLNAIAQSIPEIFGGSADLTGSNLTSLKVIYCRSYSYLHLIVHRLMSIRSPDCKNIL